MPDSPATLGWVFGGWPMQSVSPWVVALGLALSAVTSSSPASVAPAATQPPPLPAEHLTVQALPPRTAHWIFVFDEAFENETDQRLLLFDGDSYRRLGQIDAGYVPGIALAPDGSFTAVATTYFSRGSRGTRTDVVEFTNNETLGVTGEIVLPPNKRAQLFIPVYTLAYSSDAHFLYAANITPATSFEVLDPRQRKVLGEIDTAGCTMVIPSGGDRVSSLCESGRMLTVTLDTQGHEAARATSEPFFDPDADPVFVQAIPTNAGYVFLSFLGEVHPVDFRHEQPQFAPPWSLVNAEEKTWRPGGEQVGAIHKALGRLYVPMHRGGEGTHKDGGTEIWVFDLASHHRIARWPVKGFGLTRAVGIQVSQDDSPLLFLATESSQLAVLDARSGQLRHVEPHMGQTPWVLFSP